MALFNLDKDKMKNEEYEDPCKKRGVQVSDKNLERIQIQSNFNLLEDADIEILKDPDHFMSII